MACYYSRTKKVRSAVNFLEEALTIEYKQLKEVDDSESFELALLVDNPSDALLNLCVSMSDLGRHEQALQNAMQALVFIQNEIIQRGTMTKSQEPAKEGAELMKPLKDRHAVLCIAYHNIAVQHEFLKNYDAALTNYKKAYDYGSKFLVATHSLTKNMGEVYSSAMGKILEAKDKQIVRKTSPIEFYEDSES
jgi:tetratricopeptide (TPR) repeat protein